MPGQVPVDPWSAGFMALDSIASAPGPSQTAALNNTVSFDNSGFAVNVGTGTATSEKTALPSPAEAVKAVAGGAASLLSNPAFIILAGVAVYFIMRQR